MTRSAAGVAPPPALAWLGLIAGDDEYRGAVFAVAAGVVASPSRVEPGTYGRGLDSLAHLVQQHRNSVRKHVRRLTEDGFLPIARPGGGRGHPTLFHLRHPALIADTGLPGAPFSVETGLAGAPFGERQSYETGLAGAPFNPDTGLPGAPFSVETGLAGAPFPSPLLNTARVNMNMNVHVRDEVAQAVLEHGLPARGRDVDWLLEGVAERLAEGVPPDELVARFRQRYDPGRPNGWKSAKGAFMALTREPLTHVERFAANGRTAVTPTAPAFIAPDTSDALPRDELKARIAAFRSARASS